MIRSTRLLCALLVTVAVVTPAAAAVPPELVSYQGVLRSAAGAPLDGTYDMVFRFTDAPTGGTLLLTDLHTGPDAVVVTGGLFTTLLGGGTLAAGARASLGDVFADLSNVWVEVQVGAETLSPRVRIVSTAFALNARMLGGLSPGNYLDTSATPQSKAGAFGSNSGMFSTASGSQTAILATTESGVAVFADTTAATGDARGVHGRTLSQTGIGVLGSALADAGPTEGVRGQSTSPDGTGVIGGAFAGSGATVGVLGESQSPDGTGVYGRATAGSGGTTGVGGETFSQLSAGVAGIARSTAGEPWGVYGETASPQGYGVVSIGDSVTVGDMYATGSKFFVTEHPNRPDRAIRYACLEGGETGVYQRGTGVLRDGEAWVPLPDPFPLVAAGEITVQVTPVAPSGALYVPRDGIGPDGFVVREAGGSSNAEFAYLVMAERAGYEGTEPIRAISPADKILTSPRLSADQKAALRAALAAAPAERTAAGEREALFAALHAGEFDAACAALGGCAHDLAARGALGARFREPTTPAPTPTPSLAAADGASNRMVSTREPAAVVAEPRPGPPPSVLIAMHDVAGAVEAGDVLVLDPVGDGTLRVGAVAADRGVVGVAAPLDGPPADGTAAPVAIAGRVTCKVDATYGAIAAGDLLVVSPTPGHAMRSGSPAAGTVLGKALGTLEAGTGTIEILLMPR